MLFNPHSPTGHYKLDLANTGSAYVAQALALLDRWESGLAKRKGMVDISENGEPRMWSGIRPPAMTGNGLYNFIYLYINMINNGGWGDGL